MAAAVPASHRRGRRRAGGIIEAALKEGTPEERRAELIQRIPESPLLARIAIERGWLTEATPQLTELFKKAGGIPDSLDPFLPQFRDPAFHPWLRAKFRSTVSMIRLWQSDPALARDLPVFLAAPRQRVEAASRDPNGHGTDEINGLLSIGDTSALDLTLRSLDDRHSLQTSWASGYLRRWLRTADDQRLPYDDKALRRFLTGLTAADFTWNAARGLFIQKPRPTAP